jgi:PAS domain S-box-containing protein
MAWIGWNDPLTHVVGVANHYGDQTGFLDGLVIRSDDTPLGNGEMGSAIRTGHPVVINDFLGSPHSQPWREAATKSGFAASGAFPIRMGGEVIGALTVYVSENNLFGQHEIALLEEAAGDISFALDRFELDTRRQQVEEALKESEYFFKESQRAAAIGSYKADFVSGFWTSSTVMDAIFGIDESYVRSIQGWIELIHPDDRGMMEHYLQTEVIAARKPFAKQYRIIRPSDGEVRWVLGLGEGTFNDEGVFLALVGTIQDITERKEVELSLVKTHQRLQLAMESAGQGIWDWDLMTGTMTWDDGMFGLYGASRGEVQGTLQDWKDGLHPEDLDRTLAECEAALRGEAPFDTEFRVRYRDGTIRWIKAVAQVLRDAAGVPVRMLGMNQDVTAHKQDLEALRASEEKFAKIFHSAPILVALSRLEDGKLIEVNDQYCSALGFAREELVGRTTVGLGIVLPEDRELLVAAITGQGPIQSIEFNMHAKNGKVIPCLFSGEMIDVDGERLLISMLTDITELRQSEVERLRMKTEVEHLQKMESLGRLAGGVAHDMNNVLGAILALASTHLASLPQDSPLYPSLEMIRVAATRGGDMVKRLLAFSRQTPSEKHELNLNTLLLEEARLLERTTLAKVHLEMDLAPDLHLILGDGSALAHAFMNLCINAVDAMGDGGTLTFRTCNLGPDKIEVTVEDNGSGMTKEVLDRAMDPFFTTKSVGKGTGLGLSLVFTTVNTHGGHLAIQSEPGRGTRVKMTFPASDPFLRAPELRVEHPLACSSRTMNLLVVDDDDLIRSSMQAMLVAMGHAVVIASTGEEALLKLEAGFKPDVVVLDINMPGLGGADTLPRLRALNATVPVLLATGRVDQSALNLAGAYANVALLPKPFSMEELQQQLDTLQLR